MEMMFLLVCSGTLVWGITNILQKYFFKNRGVDVELMTIATMLGSSSSAFTGQLILIGLPKIPIEFWQPFIATAALNIVIIRAQYEAMKKEDVSITSSIMALVPMFTVLTSWLLLKELPSFYGLIGIFTIVVGVYVLGLKQMDSDDRETKFLFPFFKLFSSKGARIALLAAVLASISVNYDGQVARISSAPMRATSVFFTVSMFYFALSLITGRWHTMNKSYFWSLFAIGFLFSGLSNILMDWGYRYGIVPYVAALKRTQAFWTILLAGIFLKEKYTSARLLAIIFIVGGMVFLAF